MQELPEKDNFLLYGVHFKEGLMALSDSPYGGFTDTVLYQATIDTQSARRYFVEVHNNCIRIWCERNMDPDTVCCYNSIDEVPPCDKFLFADDHRWFGWPKAVLPKWYKERQQ